MTRRQTIRSMLLLFGSLTLMSLLGCQREATQTQKGSGFEEFIPIYNRYIQTWLKEQIATGDRALESARSKLADAKGDEAERLQLQLDALKRDQEKWQYRLTLGDYLRFSDPSQLPNNLAWQQGLDQPEIGDPANHPALRQQLEQFLPRRSLRLHRNAPCHSPSGNHGNDPWCRQGMGSLGRRAHCLLPSS
jgi:hypothetical protein